MSNRYTNKHCRAPQHVYRDLCMHILCSILDLDHHSHKRNNCAISKNITTKEIQQEIFLLLNYPQLYNHYETYPRLEQHFCTKLG